MSRMLFITLILAAFAPASVQARSRASAKTSTSSAAARAALESAKDAWQSLQKDAKHRKYRSSWEAVLAKFDAVAKKHPRSPEAAKALYDGAQASEDLAEVSFNASDVDAAVSAYRNLAAAYPRDSLADDALYAVARLQLARGQAEDARIALAQLLQAYPRGDMADRAKAMQAKLPAAAPAPAVANRATGDDAQAAFESAKANWQALEHDATRRKYRCFWLDAAKGFEAVANKFPGTRAAAMALYDGAVLYEDLSRISWIQDDVDAAAGLYQKLAKTYPDDRLADDALYALAQLQLSRKNDAASARASLTRMLDVHPRGDMAASARTMLAQLPKEKEEPAAHAPSKVAPRHLRPQPGEDAPVKETSVAWADDAPKRAPARPPPFVDGAAIDGNVGAQALEMDDDDDAPDGPEARAEPLQPVALGKGADKQRLAALASAVKSERDLTLSAQMGLKVRRVVIDAGHGGHDSGAVGPHGTKEKDATLAVAKKLAAKLRAEGLQVFMTRTTDRFVSLEGRAAFANAQHADLFISVHCNASTAHSLRGVETYSLNVSADRYAMRLAARENAASERSISDLQLMLADIATRADTEDSRELARLVQHSVVKGLRARYGKVRDLGTKEALFYVLLGTRMPAILVEGSFISNPQEERRLGDERFQDQLAGSIAAGVERFMGDRQALATAGLP